MIIVTILIPLADNAAQVFSPEHHRAFETTLAETFGGFTRLPGTHHGAWIDGGTLYTDATRAYQVAVAGLLERAEDIRLVRAGGGAPPRTRLKRQEAPMRYMTLLGQLVDVDADPRLERFYDSILASPNGGAAEDLLYGPANPLAAGLELRDGLPVWTAAVLRDPRWTFLLDAVARCRAACGELDVAAVMRAATWSTAEAARSLGCSEVNVRALIASGALPAVTAAGRHMLDRAAVEAYDGVRQAGHRGRRVPALYVRAGTRGDARLVVVVLGEDGRELAGELLGSADDVEELVFAEWAEAVFLGGKGDKARALHVRPLHGRAATGFGLEGLEVRGRWEILDRTNNRDEAAGLLAAIRGKASAARRAGLADRDLPEGA